MSAEWSNKLHFGDNLGILREEIGDESVDLIYLDPPFNSNATYNVLFAEKNGTSSPAQIAAFDDTWHWDISSREAYEEVVRGGGRVGALLAALHDFLGTNDMMAYLTMMAIRLKEMRRVLKASGSIYLHCDPTASHYLKLLMDAVFGAQSFRNEIIWKRTSAHSDARRCGSVHDVLLFYSASDGHTWNTTFQAYEPGYIEQYYRYADDDGRAFMSADLTGAGSGPSRMFGERGDIAPPSGRHWMYAQAGMDELLREDRIFWTRNGVPRLKRYLDEAEGIALQDVWNDVQGLRSWHEERLGYQTQKPEALLERIVQASSNEGDVVLDPFCGCGTTITVAERLHRRWIGMDITHLAVNLMKVRLHDTFGPDLQAYEVIGDPKDTGSARALAEQNRYEFEYWALGLVEASPTDDRKKGADQGIDGNIYFFDDDSGKPKRIIVQIKSGHVTRNQIGDLRGVMEREEAQMAAFVTLENPTAPMKKEAAEAGFYQPPGVLPQVPKIQLITIAELLEGQTLEYPRFAPDTFKKAPRRSKRKRKK